MRSRSNRGLLLAGTAFIALAAGPVLAQGCEEELRRVMDEFSDRPAPGAAGQEVRALVQAAHALERAGDEEACLMLVERIEAMAAEGAGAAPAEATAPEDVDDELRAALAAAEPLSGIVRLAALRELPVLTADGEEVGQIEDVVLDLGGEQVRYALLARGGGWLDLGVRQLYPIPLAAFRIADDPDWAGEGLIEEEVAEAEPAAEEEIAEADPPVEEEVAEAEPVEEHPLYAMTAGEIEGMSVVNAEGETLGSVSELFVSPADGEAHAVVAVGGFLGFMTHDIALPLREMTLGEDELVLPEHITTDELQALPEVEVHDEERIPADMVVGHAVNGAPSTEAGEQAEGPIDQAGERAEEAVDTAQEAADDAAETVRETAQDLVGDDERAEAERAEVEPAAGPDSGPRLEDKVLVLDVTLEALEGAPAFTSDSWPDFADPEWHERVAAFYADMLGTAGEPEPEEHELEEEVDEEDPSQG